MLEFVLRTGAIRSLPVDHKALYLTFDDGPDAQTTPLVLDLLARYNAKATFFTIAIHAQNHPDLIQRITDEGHALGNHSLDHRYSRFFTTKKRMLDWVTKAEQTLATVSRTESVGFRPPSGICTPELIYALRRLNEPLVLWSIRYYDSVLPWTASRALSSLKKAKSGDIVLLHDRQRSFFASAFLRTLETFLKSGREHGYSFNALTREQCMQAAQKERDL